MSAEHPPLPLRSADYLPHTAAWQRSLLFLSGTPHSAGAAADAEEPCVYQARWFSVEELRRMPGSFLFCAGEITTPLPYVI